MLAGSFRSVTARLIPGGFRAKQALWLVLPALILSGCGGSSTTKATAYRVVRVEGARFEIPAEWTVKRRSMGVEATVDGQAVEVDVFPLVHPYTASLFAKVQPELAKVIARVAQTTGGTVVGHREVTVAGLRSHAYDVHVGKVTHSYTFVLHGRREYQLLCSADASVCSHLLASFALT
jgi:hypothetical protein